MRRFYLALLLLPLVACRIEQTPQRFIDHQQTPAEELAASEAELRGRLDDMHSAIQRRSVAEAAGVLRSHPDLRVIGPAGGEILTAADEIAERLDALAGRGPGAPGESSVTVGPRNNVAWFQTEYADSADPEYGFHFSGVFVRVDGEWRLIAGHLSRPTVEPAISDPDPVPDPDPDRPTG